MAGLAAPTAIGRSAARRCRHHRVETPRSSAPAAADRIAPVRCTTRPAARQRLLPDAEFAYGGEVSSSSRSTVSIERQIPVRKILECRSPCAPSFRSDAGRLDERPPFLYFGLLQCAQRFR